MNEVFVKLEGYINNCLLSRLSKCYNESEFPIEYSQRNQKIVQFMPKLLELLEEIDIKQLPDIEASTLYSLLILYLELQSVGPWNCTSYKDIKYSEKMDIMFLNKYGVPLKNILKEDVFDSQQIFDKCMKEIHQKMTLADLKRYPGLIEVYWTLISNLKSYRVKVNPVTVIPVSLLLIDDYVAENKIKGLKCCMLILQSLDAGEFVSSNYYEVVHISLTKNIVEKDLEVTKCLFRCILEFLNILQADIQKKKLSDYFSSILDQLQIESNLHRKAGCLDFVTKIIEMHGVHCTRKKIFAEIIADALDVCTNAGVSEILLHHVLECLQMWIKYCWCIWKLPTHHKILSKLFVLHYLSQNESVQIQNIIVTLVKLCTTDEQMKIYNTLESFDKDVGNRFNIIKDKIKT